MNALIIAFVYGAVVFHAHRSQYSQVFFKIN